MKIIFLSICLLISVSSFSGGVSVGNGSIVKMEAHRDFNSIIEMQEAMPDLSMETKQLVKDKFASNNTCVKAVDLQQVELQYIRRWNDNHYGPEKINPLFFYKVKFCK